MIVLENEVLRVTVLATKGADIIEFRYKPRDLDFLWHAPQPILPAGRGVPSSARAQGAFLDYFPGGWQEILPNAGPATKYKGAELGQHGDGNRYFAAETETNNRTPCTQYKESRCRRADDSAERE